MQKEIWKSVINYEKLYKVSNCGRIKSLPRNGTIKNDDLLFKNENLQSIAQVDSEVIFSMLNNINYDDFSTRFVSEIQRYTEKLTGSFTTLSVNLKHPHKLLLLKYDQPISYHYSHSLDTLFFTSRYIFLRKAFGRPVITEALRSKTAYLFNLSSDSKPRGKPVLQFPIVSADNNIKKMNTTIPVTGQGNG